VTETALEADCTGDTVSEAVDVAVIVTVGFSDHGRSVAGVKVMDWPLLLWEELNVPQFELIAQAAVQSTPPGAMSLVIVALNVAG